MHLLVIINNIRITINNNLVLFWRERMFLSWVIQGNFHPKSSAPITTTLLGMVVINLHTGEGPS